MHCRSIVVVLVVVGCVLDKAHARGTPSAAAAAAAGMIIIGSIAVAAASWMLLLQSGRLHGPRQGLFAAPTATVVVGTGRILGGRSSHHRAAIVVAVARRKHNMCEYINMYR